MVVLHENTHRVPVSEQMLPVSEPVHTMATLFKVLVGLLTVYLE